MSRKSSKLPHEKTLRAQGLRLKTAIALAGGQNKIAETLGVSQAAVSKWVVQGFVPVRRAAEMEATIGLPRLEIVHPRIAETFKPADFGVAA